MLPADVAQLWAGREALPKESVAVEGRVSEQAHPPVSLFVRMHGSVPAVETFLSFAEVKILQFRPPVVAYRPGCFGTYFMLGSNLYVVHVTANASHPAIRCGKWVSY